MAVEAPTQRAPDRARRQHIRRGDAPHLRVALLGRFAVGRDGADVSLPPAAARLVALIALRGGAVHRSRVAATLWPELLEERAAASLRATLSRLGRACPGLLEIDPASLRLAEAVAVDAREVERLALRILDGGTCDAPSVVALAVELLPDWSDDWVQFERDRLLELCLQAIEALTERLTQERRYGLATATIYEALRIDPLRESAVRALIEIHLAQGNRAQAVRCFLGFRARLRSELGVEPSESLRALMEPLLARAERT